MSNTVVLFTLNTCEYCNSLKERLYNLSIPFNELDVEKCEDIWNKIVEETESDSVPVILIYDENDNGEIYVPGKDYETEDEIVEIIKKGT